MSAILGNKVSLLVTENHEQENQLENEKKYKDNPRQKRIEEYGSMMDHLNNSAGRQAAKGIPAPTAGESLEEAVAAIRDECRERCKQSVWYEVVVGLLGPRLVRRRPPAEGATTQRERKGATTRGERKQTETDEGGRSETAPSEPPAPKKPTQPPGGGAPDEPQERQDERETDSGLSELEGSEIGVTRASDSSATTLGGGRAGGSIPAEWLELGSLPGITAAGDANQPGPSGLRTHWTFQPPWDWPDDEWIYVPDEWEDPCQYPSNYCQPSSGGGGGIWKALYEELFGGVHPDEPV
jgi:hypothetical protein